MRKRVVYFYLLLMLVGIKTFSQQPTLILPIGHSERVVSAKLSPDGKLALTVSTDGTAKLWETGSGKLLKDFKSQGDASIVLVTGARFSPAGKKAFIYYEYDEIRMYDIATGNFIEEGVALNDKESFYAGYYQFSPDNKRINEITELGRLWVLDVETLKPVFILKTPGSKISKFAYSRDGKKIATYSSDGGVRTWDAQTGKPLLLSKQTPKNVLDIAFSWDDKTITYTISDDSPVTIDAVTGKKLTQLKFDGGPDLEEKVLYKISKDGRFCIKLNKYNGYYNNIQFLEYWDSLSVYDKKTGRLSYARNNLLVPVGSDFLSPDGSRILALKKQDSSFCMIETATGKELFAIQRKNEIHAVSFSADGKKFFIADGDEVIIYDSQTGKPAESFPAISGFSTVYDARISEDGKKMITGNENKKAALWDISSKTGPAPLKPVNELKAETLSLLGTQYDPSGKKIIIKTTGNDLVWDIENGSLSPLPLKNNGDTSEINWHIATRAGNITYDSLVLSWLVDIIVVQNIYTDQYYSFWTSEKEIHNHVQLSPDHKRVIATSANNSIKIYDLENPKPILRLVIIDNSNYLVIDSSSRYDGTDAARKLLHFVCGNEIVGLDQVKDQLWVPDLARRISRGEAINSKTIDELSICSLTPAVEQSKGIAGEFYFKIKPRSGGLGETVVSFNGTPTLSIQPSQLKKVGNAYELRLFKKDLLGYFIAGQENSIAIKAYTANNSSSSRPLVIIDDPGKEKRTPPNLFGVMVGVSNYKGEKMDLEYAANDATEISATISNAAKKLLGNDHVFMYNLTTDSGYLFPEKKAIKRTLDDIATKAGPNDILFIFLSGHGVMHDKTKQFYYMTADASSLSDEASFKDVGLSMTELTDWIKPQNIKAQKRILILDACKSGQAINNMIPDHRLLAVRGDNDAQQVKAIDKLNERSGLFILSASTSSQVAFESGIYGHGYLTFSLLKVIKEKPDILDEGKYLNVSRWFNTAAQTVSDITKQDPSRQEPQIVTNTDFNVGLVDNEVIAKIKLSEDAKTLFTSGNFLNIAISDDDLGMRKLIDKRLDDLSKTEAGKNILFLPSSGSFEAYSLAGGYAVKENAITIKVNLKKGDDSKQQFDMAGTKDKLNELADAIITKAIEWIEANK
ncbi:MAG: hypothetical protein HOP10_06340 [Chitinophagaceae bacterium]|nr:hypothetical protein [Chitinophagaceae bacterium]